MKRLSIPCMVLLLVVPTMVYCVASARAQKPSADVTTEPCPITEIGREVTADHEWYRYQGEDSTLLDKEGMNPLCGQTCVAMAIQFVTGEEVPLKLILEDIPWGTTDTNDLVKGLEKHGIGHTRIANGDMAKIEAAVNISGHIVIMWLKMSEITPGLDYNTVREQSAPGYRCGKYIPYGLGHWVIVKGISTDRKWVKVYDPDAFINGKGSPYWYSDGTAKGKDRYYPYSDLQNAHRGVGGLDDSIEILPESSCPPGGGAIATLYSNRDYRCEPSQNDPGFRALAKPEWQNCTGGFDDRASSLRVPEGWSVRVWELPDRRGGTACFSANQPALDGKFDNCALVDNAISSFQVYDVPGCGAEPPLHDLRAELIRGSSYQFVQPGQPFELTVEFQNTGDVAWIPGGEYALVRTDGESLGVIAPLVVITDICPGRIAELVLPMVAPNQLGHVQTEWHMAREGKPFGGGYRCQIFVIPDLAKGLDPGQLIDELTREIKRQIAERAAEIIQQITQGLLRWAVQAIGDIWEGFARECCGVTALGPFAILATIWGKSLSRIAKRK